MPNLIREIQTHGDLGYRYFDGDDLWEGAEPGWYYGEILVDEDGEMSLGDTVGPFATEEDVWADINNIMKE